MKTFWIIATIVFIFCLFVSYSKNKRFITVSNIVFLTTSVNFILYLLDWSKDFTLGCLDITYCIIGIVEIMFSIYALKNNKIKLEKKTDMYYLKSVKIGSLKFYLSSIILVICILLTMVEAIYLTGSFFQLNSGEFHTSSMPVIGTMVRGLYPVGYISAYLDWRKYKKKRTIVLFSICLIYSLFALGSRFWTIISILTACFFIVEYEHQLIKNLSLKSKIGICVMGYLGLLVFLQLGINRVGENHVYMDLIGYNGPFKGSWLGMVLSWFYGYFPYSYNNMNVTLKHILDFDVCTHGQFLLYPYVSFLHLDGLFGIDYGNITMNVRIIKNTAATVATGYYEFYSDFRNLFFIGILIFVIITWKLENKRDLSGLIGFSAMEVVWFLMSFNNLYTVGITLYVFLFAWILNKFFAIRYKKNTTSKNFD